MPDYAYAILGISIIFIATTLGALFVLFFKQKNISSTLNRIFVGFAAGVMLCASFTSLIIPALKENTTYMPIWLIVGLSIALGAGFLWLIDKLVPHIHPNEDKEEGLPSHGLSKTSKMFLAVTIHNIPEGLSLGIAFGVALANPDKPELLTGAFLLAIGLGIQNIPEGLAVALPIKGETGSSLKAFVFGMLSGAVEPVAAVFGLFLAMQIQVIMPWALAFAAGCMIYVIAEEMVPEMKGEGHDHFGVWSFIVGLVIMLALECIQF